LGIFFAYHQEFSTVHSALVSFMQVSDDHFQAESGWNILKFKKKSIMMHGNMNVKFMLTFLSFFSQPMHSAVEIDIIQ